MNHYVDIGVNLSNKRLLPQADALIAAAAGVGVLRMVVTATSLQHSRLAQQLCRAHPGQLRATCGVHPHDAREWNEQTRAQIAALAQRQAVVAIGETGLDYNRNFSPREQQLQAFEAQLELAAERQLPVFLHQRDALEDFMALLRRYRDRLPGAVAHCFTEGREALFRLLDLDCHIGITGWVCDERRGQALREAVPHIPAGRLMLETDAPYLLPRDLEHPPGDRINRPEYLPRIAATVARLQHKPLEQLAREAWDNSIAFFNLQAEETAS
jgi:TatD DNase family protein